VLLLTEEPFDPRNVYMTHNPEQLAAYHFARAEHYERLKMASANNPTLFYQYAEQQFHHKALAHRYKAISAGGMMMMPHPMMGGM
jgi:hypothetical protein